MKLVYTFLASTICISTLACNSAPVPVSAGSGSSPSAPSTSSTPTPAPAATSADQDVTTSILPSLVGSYVSPQASFQIHSDASFNLETLQENLSNNANQKTHPQHRTFCDITRTGSLQIINRNQNQILRLNITTKTLTNEDGDPSCTHLISSSSQTDTADLPITISNSGSFLLENGPDQQIPAEFGFLFTPHGKQVDVTDLTSDDLWGTFQAQDSNSDSLTISIAFDSKTLHFVDTQCEIDVSSNFSVTSQGTQIVLSIGSTENTARDFMGPNHEGTCEQRKRVFQSGGSILDVTHPMNLIGLNDLKGISFSPTTDTQEHER